jgi:ATPase subunit of ABC transporter with duplicated ATPase domains
LNIALQRFEGTALLVAHDQDLIEEVGTRIWPLDQHTITDFKGAYKQYTAALA